MSELKTEIKRFYVKNIKDHFLALNNEGFQKHSLNVLKYIGLGVFDKVYHLDIQNAYFGEPDRNVIFDLLDLSKMIGVKVYNFATRRKLQNVDKSI